jgi:hypothetical protein
MRKIVEHFENCSKIIVNEKNNIVHIPQLEKLVENFERTWVKIPLTNSKITLYPLKADMQIEVGERLTEMLKKRVLTLRHKFNYYE